MLDYNSTCSCCGKQQQGLPLDAGTSAPDAYWGVPEAERPARTGLSGAFCEVDGQAYIRGLVELPIIGRNETFAWGVWISLSAASYRIVQEVWDQPDREKAGPFFGWFSVRPPLYPDTISLKARAHLRPLGGAPWIELQPADHALAVEQRGGITIARVIEIAEALMPRH